MDERKKALLMKITVGLILAILFQIFAKKLGIFG
jgi:hypothetical protein